MHILFTGASSFTGLAFVEALTAAGHEVVCPLRGAVGDYTGIRRNRVERLRSIASITPYVAFGSEAFLRLLREGKPWDLLCHHAAEVTDYKSPAFDAFKALEHNANHISDVLLSFQRNGGKAVVLTGTVFEPDEGQGDKPLRAFSPYGLSKGLTWQVFWFYCGRASVPLGKFVIPNPFGPWEEPRFTAYLMNTWKHGQTATVKTPDYTRDNIHAELLARVYAKFVEQVAASRVTFTKVNPSGYVETQGAFALRVAREVRTRVDWPCGLELAVQQDFSEPLVRVNTQPATQWIPQWNERAAWDAFVEFYTTAELQQ